MSALLTAAGPPVARRDIAITVAMSLAGVFLMYFDNVQDDAVDASVWAVPTFVAVTLPLLWRRSAPIAAGAGVLVALLVHLALFGPEVARCALAIPTVYFLVFAAAAQLERREALVALALGLALIAIEGLYFMGAWALLMGSVAVAVWGIGRVVRSRAQMVTELKTRTGALQQARDDRARMEVATDRARVSGELDALLQRRLGALAQLADAAAHTRDGADAAAALVDIESQSRNTLEQMRSIVGLLRDDSAGAPVAPQPTLTHLEALLVRAKGTQARLVVHGSPRVLPVGVELSAYRIVEHLLGALEDGADVEVRVSFADDALELAVCGRARRRAKDPIERARARVGLHRGTLQATTHGGRAEAIAHLPLVNTSA